MTKNFIKFLKPSIHRLFLPQGVRKMASSTPSDDNKKPDRNPVPEVIEIERKFIFNDESISKLCKLGAELVSQVTFYDTYYDTPDYRLTLNDHWMRCRDDTWQLKCPPPNHGLNVDAMVQYAEYESVPEIVRLLKQCLGQEEESGDDESDMKRFLDRMGCTKCAEFESTRDTYRMKEKDTDLRIDLDQTNFGYTLGEIEILVGDQKEAPDAIARIDSLAHRLGVYTEEKIPGKILVYLKQHNPEHYTKICDKFYVGKSTE